MSQPQRHYTLDDYFAVEEMSVVKHEFFEGEIFAMAGESFATTDVTTTLRLTAVPLELPLREIYREVFA